MIRSAPGLPFCAEVVRFQSGPYRLEGQLAYPETGRPLGAVVIAGPHPALGGDLNNNVVRALGDGLAELGFVTLRFNYRGVGRSEGPTVDRVAQLAEFWRTSHVADEMDAHHDLAAAVASLRPIVALQQPRFLLGYSFGCVLLPRVSECQGRILVAPTVGKHDYSPYQRLGEDVLVVISEDDFAAPAAVLESWFRSLPSAQLVRRQLDNHFFRGQEAWLVGTVGSFLLRRTREV
jgi:alpha/beta superfamily hydrolase